MQPLSDDDPAQIGQYRLRNRLGAGGMGQVYLAATAAGRLVALKVIRPELSHDQEFRARFHQEIQAARRVRGLYTAELVDADPDAAWPWLATAYVPGPSLKEFVDEKGPVPEGEAFRLLASVAEALQAIHSAGVVHRDLKPSNVVLGPDGLRVIDFGIARALEAATLTRTGVKVGTPGFMAPEQILGSPVTPMIDVFALGALAAYVVLGRPPFGNGIAEAVSYRVLHKPPDLNGCPARIRSLIEQCLAKQRARPATGGPGHPVLPGTRGHSARTGPGPIGRLADRDCGRTPRGTCIAGDSEHPASAAPRQAACHARAAPPGPAAGQQAPPRRAPEGRSARDSRRGNRGDSGVRAARAHPPVSERRRDRPLYVFVLFIERWPRTG